MKLELKKDYKTDKTNRQRASLSDICNPFVCYLDTGYVYRSICDVGVRGFPVYANVLDPCNRTCNGGWSVEANNAAVHSLEIR